MPPELPRPRRWASSGAEGGRRWSGVLVASSVRATEPRSTPDCGERHLGGGGGDVGQRLVVGRVAAFLDAGAAHDPARLEAETLLDFGVGHAAFRHVVAEADDAIRRPLMPRSPERRGASAIAA